MYMCKYFAVMENGLKSQMIYFNKNDYSINSINSY